MILHRKISSRISHNSFKWMKSVENQVGVTKRNQRKNFFHFKFHFNRRILLSKKKEKRSKNITNNLSTENPQVWRRFFHSKVKLSIRHIDAVQKVEEIKLFLFNLIANALTAHKFWVFLNVSSYVKCKQITITFTTNFIAINSSQLIFFLGLLVNKIQVNV